MTLGLALAVAAACGLAASARYALSLAATGAFPWPTVVVNTAGAALLGWALAAHAAGDLGASALAVVGAGLAGGLSTFSTLAVDAVRLANERLWRLFWAYLALTVVLGLAASWAAWTVTSLVSG